MASLTSAYETCLENCQQEFDKMVGLARRLASMCSQSKTASSEWTALRGQRREAEGKTKAEASKRRFEKRKRFQGKQRAWRFVALPF